MVYMSKEFIEKKCNSNSLDLAARQQRQLSYFITSEIQEESRIDYFEEYAKSKFYGNDVFLNWVKSVFKHENFLAFYKYFRNPNPSSRLINTRIKEPLTRVFFSEDSHFNYIIKGEHVERPEELSDGFEKELFDAVLFRHNDIIVHDLKDINDPYRKFVGIDKVISIDVDRGKIHKLAYTGVVNIDDEEIYGYVYLDDETYKFYSKSYELLITEPHDYGQCPATFVVDDNFGNDKIAKESIFSYIRADLEEYCFLVTLQRMTHTNGAFPIVTKIKTKEVSNTSDDFDNNGSEPMSLEQLGSQVSQEARGTAGSGKGNVLQAGTVIEVPALMKADESIDVELAKNFLTFYHTPVEILDYINKKIIELENKIITSCVGDYSEGANEASMTEMQVQKGFVTRDDKLRWLSRILSTSRQVSDKMMLSLKYGKGNVNVDLFYGSDFFLETQAKIYEMIKASPNSIERKNNMIRLSQRRNMFNKEKSKREVILYKLLPYSSDEDFKLAVDQQRISDEIFEYQIRFTYWVSMFEYTYGNIVSFWNDTVGSDSQKMLFINELILDIVNKNSDFKQQNLEKNGKETSN